MTPAQRYSGVSVALHWLMLALLIGVYASIELREMFPRGSEPRELFKAWHFTLGLTVFVLVWVRLAAKILGNRPPIEPPAPKWQMLIAQIVELALYGLMIVLPLLGWLTLSAEGEAISFFGLHVPPLVSENEELAERIEGVHVVLATSGYFLVGLHTLAALYHHYVRRDNTLKRMLPFGT
ncbi:MAG TPA: cytochrome b [Steroidobacteraceae bacterium]